MSGQTTRTMYQHWLYRAFPLRDDFMESFLVMCTNLAWQPKTSGKVAVKPNVGLEFSMDPFVRLFRNASKIFWTLASAFDITGYLNSENPHTFLWTKRFVCQIEMERLELIANPNPRETKANIVFFVSETKRNRERGILWVEFQKLFICTFLNKLHRKLFLLSRRNEFFPGN